MEERMTPSKEEKEHEEHVCAPLRCTRALSSLFLSSSSSEDIIMSNRKRKRGDISVATKRRKMCTKVQETHVSSTSEEAEEQEEEEEEQEVYVTLEEEAVEAAERDAQSDSDDFDRVVLCAQTLQDDVEQEDVALAHKMPIGGNLDYCFTAFLHPRHVLVAPKYDEFHMWFLVWQIEKCPKTAKLHYQGYVQFREKKTFKQATKHMQLSKLKHHLERRMGKSADAATYCRKLDSRATPEHVREAGFGSDLQLNAEHGFLHPRMKGTRPDHVVPPTKENKESSDPVVKRKAWDVQQQQSEIGYEIAVRIGDQIREDENEREGKVNSHYSSDKMREIIVNPLPHYKKFKGTDEHNFLEAKKKEKAERLERE